MKRNWTGKIGPMQVARDGCRFQARGRDRVKTRSCRVRYICGKWVVGPFFSFFRGARITHTYVHIGTIWGMVGLGFFFVGRWVIWYVPMGEGDFRG